MNHPRRRAFSLIGLLAILGILAILIALLMPALVRARQAANSVACQSNLRQIFSAALQRSIEHGGYVSIAGQINGMPDTTPATLNDSDQKRYLWYDDAGIHRPAPIQAALATYLGNKNVRLDGADSLLSDIDQGTIKRLFTCPAQAEPIPAGYVIGASRTWLGPRMPGSYAFNEGLMGFEDTPRRRRGDLRAANPASAVLFMTDALPRTEEVMSPYIVWTPTAAGRCTLADCYTNANGTYEAGVASQFDWLRHPRFRINISFCDGHVESLTISPRELARVVVLSD